jgi:poly-beta-hydroxyalkanoate depolymerase
MPSAVADLELTGRRWRTTICPQIAEFVRKY